MAYRDDSGRCRTNKGKFTKASACGRGGMSGLGGAGSMDTGIKLVKVPQGWAFVETMFPTRPVPINPGVPLYFGSKAVAVRQLPARHVVRSNGAVVIKF